MLPDIKFLDDRIDLEGVVHSTGAFTSTGPFTATGGLTAIGGEVTSLGNVAGFSFADRSKAGLFQNFQQARGDRYVWYCDQGVARLWSGGDMLTVTWSDASTGNVLVSIENGMLDVDSIETNTLILKGVGVVADAIKKLADRVAVLEEAAKPQTPPAPMPAPPHPGPFHPSPIIER